MQVQENGLQGQQSGWNLRSDIEPNSHFLSLLLLSSVR